MFRCYSYAIVRESTAEQCNVQTPIKTQYMQPHHHRINHTPMYFNGLF